MVGNGSVVIGVRLSVAAAAVSILLVPSVALGAATIGSLDDSYGTDGSGDAIIQGPSGAAYDPSGLAALSDGSSLIADADGLGITHLTAAGAPDPSFGSGGTATVAYGSVGAARSAAVASTPIAGGGSSYLVTGTIDENDLAVAEFNSDGTLDTSFASSSATPGVYEFNNSPVQGTQAYSSMGQDLVVQSDGTIIVVGTEDIGSPSEPALIVDRITTDGSADERFSIQADGQPTTGEAVALGSNGTIYVAGTENAGAASAKAVLVRLVRSGFPAALKLDPTFNPSGPTPGVLTTTLGGSSAQADALAVAADGDVLIGGQVVSGTDRGVVARVTPSGGLDPTFGSAGVVALQSPASSPMSFVRGMVLEPDGAPVIAGDSDHANPSPGELAPNVSFLAQLTTTGALDSSFNPGPDAGVVFQSAQSDSPTGYDDGGVTGLAIDQQGRLLLAADRFSTGAGPPDEGTVTRYFDYAPPVAAFSAPAAVIAGQPATFDASASSDPVGSISDYAWDFDGTDTFATDGGAAATIQHTFSTPETVSVSVRVSNAAGWTSTVSYPVTVLAKSHSPAPPGPTPEVSLSASSLSFQANINDFDGTETDSPPQTVTVTNTGTGPLTISGAQVINSVGGFAISDRCISTLGSDGTYSSSCIQTQTPADTCSKTTLAPGTRCSISVQYQDGGQYPSATGALAIESNAASSPDLVTLKATATIVPNNSGGAGTDRCPGVIPADGAQLQGCWTDVTNSYYPSTADTWASFGPVTVDGQLTLMPTEPNDELFAGNGTLSATPANAKYIVEVSTSSAPPSIPVGAVDLGSTPLVCIPGDDKGCGTILNIEPNGYTYHGLKITGGFSAFAGGNVVPGGGTVCSSANTEIDAELPRLFSTAPDPGASPPTVSFGFGGCVQTAGVGAGIGGGVNPVTCPGEKTPTPDCNGHTVIRDQPSFRRRSFTRAAGTPASTARTPRADADQSDPCPNGDEDYTNAVPEAFVGAMRFGNPYLCYDPITQIWTAGGTINVLGATVDTGPPPAYGISFNTDGAFVSGAIQSVTFNPAIEIAPGVALASFSGGFAVAPTTRLGLSATVDVAGVLTITGSGFAVWASSKYPYTYDGNGPFSIQGVPNLQTNTTTDPLTDFAAGAGGTVSLDVPVLGSIPLAKAYVFFAAPSYFEFGGAIGFPAANIDPSGGCSGWCVNGSVLGAVDTGNGEYNVAGGVQACANFPGVGQECVGLSGVVSSVGLGVCGNLGPFDGGFTYSWGGGPSFFGGASVAGVSVGTSCHSGLGPVTVAVQRSRAVDTDIAHVDAASGAVSLKLAGGIPSTSIYVKGAGGPPGLALTGPGGQSLSEPGTGKGIRAGDLIIWPEPEFDETVIEIAHPAAGSWTLTPLPGSPAIASVSYADVLARPAITATVTGEDHVRTLHYHVRPRPGQRVTFAEHAGRVFHIIGRARGDAGTLRFTPAAGPGGRRRIVALISLASGPAPSLVVGEYVAPTLTPGRPSDVRLTRHGGTLRISWGAAINASEYLAEVSLSDGRRASYEEPARRRTVTIATVGASVSGRVQVMAINATGQIGRAAVATLSPVAGPGRIIGLKAKRTGKRVEITWHRVRGATLYILRLTLGRTLSYAPEFLTEPRFVSTKTLPQLRAGGTATVTVTAVARSGAEGPAARLRYRAR